MFNENLDNTQHYDNKFNFPEEVNNAFSQEILSSNIYNISQNESAAYVINKLDLSKYDFILITNLLLSLIWDSSKCKTNDTIKEAILKVINRLIELYKNKKSI